MKNQWIIGISILALTAWVACGPKNLPEETSEPSTQDETQDLNFENNNSNNSNQNNSNNQNTNLDAGPVQVQLDAGVTEEEPEPEPIEEPSAGACDNDADESILGTLDDDLDGIIESCALWCFSFL